MVEILRATLRLCSRFALLAIVLAAASLAASGRAQAHECDHAAAQVQHHAAPAQTAKHESAQRHGDHATQDQGCRCISSLCSPVLHSVGAPALKLSPAQFRHGKPGSSHARAQTALLPFPEPPRV